MIARVSDVVAATWWQRRGGSDVVAVAWQQRRSGVATTRQQRGETCLQQQDRTALPLSAVAPPGRE